MPEATKTGNGGSAAQPAAQAQQVQVRVLAQYIKDLSFESPNVHKLLDGPGEAPGSSETSSSVAWCTPFREIHTIDGGASVSSPGGTT